MEFLIELLKDCINYANHASLFATRLEIPSVYSNKIHNEIMLNDYIQMLNDIIPRINEELKNYNENKDI